MTNALQCRQLVEAIRPMLVGKSPEVQSAVLADLASMWIAGHVCIGDMKATEALRAEITERFVELINDLIEPNAELLGTNKVARGETHNEI